MSRRQAGFSSCFASLRSSFSFFLFAFQFVLDLLEDLPGLARTKQNDLIAWLLERDTQLLIFNDPQTDSGVAKKPMCFATLACACCQNTGVTTLTMVDHDVVPTLKARF